MDVPDLSTAWTLRQALSEFSTPADREEDGRVRPAFEFLCRSTRPIARGLMVCLRSGELVAFGRPRAGNYARVPTEAWSHHEFEFDCFSGNARTVAEPYVTIHAIRIVRGRDANGNANGSLARGRGGLRRTVESVLRQLYPPSGLEFEGRMGKVILIEVNKKLPKGVVCTEITLRRAIAQLRGRTEASKAAPSPIDRN